ADPRTSPAAPDRRLVGRPRARPVHGDPDRLPARVRHAEPLVVRATASARLDRGPAHGPRRGRRRNRRDAPLEPDRRRLPRRLAVLLPAVLARGRAPGLRARAERERKRDLPLAAVAVRRPRQLSALPDASD